MKEVNEIIKDIKQKSYKPIYFLFGEEPYYIDYISDYIENTVLTDDEKAFNQTILYGRDTSIGEIISSARRFPMMAEHQVVLVKEAQNLKKNFEDLMPYLTNPQPTTILVFAFRDKPDGRKGIFKELKKNGVYFESKKLYDNQIPDWILNTAKEMGYTIEPKAAMMLFEFLGTNLGKIINELNKLKIILPPNHNITPKDIEVNIGISKDFNAFELKAALAGKNGYKAYAIIDYFYHSPKDNPIVLITSTLYSFFSQVLEFHGLHDKSKPNAMKKMGLNWFSFDDVAKACQLYPMPKVSECIYLLRQLDVKTKGVGANAINDYELLKETVFKILN